MNSFLHPARSFATCSKTLRALCPAFLLCLLPFGVCRASTAETPAPKPDADFTQLSLEELGSPDLSDFDIGELTGDDGSGEIEEIDEVEELDEEDLLDEDDTPPPKKK